MVVTSSTRDLNCVSSFLSLKLIGCSVTSCAFMQRVFQCFYDRNKAASEKWKEIKQRLAKQVPST